MQAAQEALVAKSMALQGCFSANGYSAETCADQRRAYESDLAAFRAKYGK